MTRSVERPRVRAAGKARILPPVRTTTSVWGAAIALGLALGTGGCAGGGAGGGGGPGGGGALADGATEAPAVAGISVEVRQVKFSQPAAARFGTRVQQPLSRAEQTIVDGLVGGELRHEPGLSRAARELARTAPDRSNIPSGLIDGVMAWVGLVDPPPRLAVVELPPGGLPCGDELSESCRDALQSVIKATREGLVMGPGPRWIGAGMAPLADGTVRMVVAVSERAVQLDPLPTAVQLGAKVRVHGRLLGKRSRPSIEVVAPDGRWVTLPARVSKQEFTAEMACRGRGAHQIEVLAEGAYGPEVVANFPVQCGAVPPDALRVEVETVGPDVSAADVARSNFTALNNTRARQGLPPLQWDNQAAEIAAAHSQDMLSGNFVGHTSPRTGDVEARFRRAGATTAVLRENVARGYGPRGIHDSLMASPGHRVNILADDVTHVGIGAVIGPPETPTAGAPRPIFLTQNFFSRLGDDTPADPVAALRQRVDALRQRAGLRPATWEAPLFEAGQALAEGIAAGEKAQASQAFAARLERLPYKQVAHHEVLAPSFASLDTLSVWKEPDLGLVGLGVRQVEKGADAGSLVVIVVVARR
jgi:uncharacterized protein YkwD